jgi:NAD(P)-dependent dehydrogenase (short-subunit alcohol dehydrogenase family)
MCMLLELEFSNLYVSWCGAFNNPSTDIEKSWSNFWDDTEDDRYAEVDININHPIKLSRIALRALLRKNKKGVILITASLSGFQGTFSAPLYSATKHAIVGFVRSMAELDALEGIKVCAVAPGFVPLS